MEGPQVMWHSDPLPQGVNAVNIINRSWVALSTFLAPPSKKDDRGAGIVEYAAILILVAAIAVAIFSLGLPDIIRGAIGSAVSDVIDGP